MQSVPRVVLPLVLLLSWTASIYSQTRNKQELAEATADTGIRRFYETLDSLFTINDSRTCAE